MAFIEMVGRDLETEHLQDTRTPDSEDDFLLETIDLIAAVEMMGDPAIIGPVLIEIGIEQQHRDAMAEGAGEPVEPRAYPDLAALDCHCNHDIEWIRPVLRLPWIGLRHLTSVRIDVLPYIAGPTDQAHEHDRQLQVGGGARHVACQHAKAASISMHLRA